MALTNSYLVTTKNLAAFLNAIRSAKAPDHFTNRFLVQLEFKSTNDRLFIGVLKGLGFLDDAGAPTKRYFEYLDQSQSGRILAEAIQEAYEDLFQVNTKAQELSQIDIKNKLRTLTAGQKSGAVIDKMAATFKALCAQADWTISRPAERERVNPIEGPVVGSNEHQEAPDAMVKRERGHVHPTLQYNIQIVLPESRDPAVYDALFRSLREHLL